MPTKNTSNSHARDNLRNEYALDYAKSSANRFATKLADTTAIVLQPDVAKVFRSSSAVNALLRSAIAATGARAPRRSGGESGGGAERQSK